MAELAASGAPLRVIAAELDRSIATIRYWLARWEIKRADARLTRVNPVTAPRETQRECVRHGVTLFRLDARGTYRCPSCSQEAVAARRRRMKRLLVEEAGGGCAACGYNRCTAALQFHHLDPSQKTFGLATKGVTRAIAQVRAEAKKCVLLCANCHAEVEAGVRRLDAA